MSPNPNESAEMQLSGEDIVISGISGLFPLAENTHKLIDNLYNKVDMITKYEYSNTKHPELPHYLGKIDDIDKFDSNFFRVPYRHASVFDPAGRKTIEQAYSAMFDAGINPETLKGTKIGVFIGSTESDSAESDMYNVFYNNGFIISGCSKTMPSNRISYWMDGKGPSYGLDYSNASSIACLEIACERIRSGECDSAIVGGFNNVIHPILSINMNRAGLLCFDGKTKCFDKNGDGFARSDAVSLMFLQKAKDAKRIYTQIYHIKGEYVSSPDAAFLPIHTDGSKKIENFLKKFYSEIDVSPEAVEYVEANATGVADSDKKELEAIGNIFGKTKPIKVGSIKSNLGHTEPASGICSLTKICISYQRGEIPANLHYKEPQNEIAVIREEKVQVVTDNTKFGRSFTALNNFSSTGANYHVLLKGHYKPKDINKYKSEIPRLVLASGRLEQSVNKILSLLENNPIDPEQIALLNNIFKYNIRGHTGRGYTIIETNAEKNKTMCLGKGFEIYSGSKRPVWFLYSGMGSQWPTMGADLMRVPVFAATVKRCAAVLTPKGIDIIKIITNNDKEIFENILNCFVGITSIQIALTEVLRSIGVAPDGIIGHSAGELSCAYADGSLTLEEAITISYLRGIVSLETKTINGKMAAIGMGHKEVRKLCPPEIDIACQNSSESTTISGPADVIDKFVALLTERSIFARTVSSSDIAYHSRYIADMGPNLMSKIKGVVKNPKARSKLWHSTCFSADRWTEEISLYASAEYFTYNNLNPVLFEETANMIPKDAIVIELAPHGLMQAIMKRSHKNCINLSLTRRGEKSPVILLLRTIGILYQNGLNPNIDALYPKIDFPVSTETSVLSHFIHWDHSEQWTNGQYKPIKKITSFSYEFNTSIHDDDHSFIQGFIRNGVNVFPEAAVLVIAWKTLAMSVGRDYQNMPIQFMNVKFHREIIIKSEEVLKLLVQIQKGTKCFEISQNDELVASGLMTTDLIVDHKYDNIQFADSDCHLNSKDIYTLMSTKGYNYKDQFKTMEHINIERNKGILKWTDNWITFLDAIFQLNAVSRNHNGVSKIKLITRLSIDVEAHKRKKNIGFDSKRDIIRYAAQVSRKNAVTECGGILLKDIIFEDIPKVEQTANVLQIKQKIPYNPKFSVDLKMALQVNLQILSDNIKETIFIHSNETDLFNNILDIIKDIVETVPSLNVETISDKNSEAKHDVLLLSNVDSNKIDQSIRDAAGDFRFVIAITNQENTLSLLKNFNVKSTFKFENRKMVLLENSTSTILNENLSGYYYIPTIPVQPIIDNVKLINGISNNTYEWAEIPCTLNEKNIQIAYCGVQINDTEQCADIDKNVNKHGIGFSGINVRGERVMGVAPESSVSSLVEANYNLLWPVPKHWTLEEAATVPLPYIQAYYCLMIRENLSKRSKVFVTKGDSALGQAVIQLCLSLDCTVLTTVSTITKKKFLMNNFRKLKESHIGFYNDLSFIYNVLKATQNKLCDIVINCDKGILRQDAMKYVGSFQTYYDVCDHDMEENEDYGMSFNVVGKCYKSVRLSNIFLPEHSSDRKKLQILLSEGITNGNVRPLSRVTYSSDEVSRALKLLSNDNTSNVILINMKNPEISSEHKILHRIQLSSSKSYIVVCDGTELSVELIEHLIQRGAKQFLIHMKPKLMNGYFHVKYASWKNNDVIINFNSDDLNTKAGCDTLIRQGEKLGAVDGIFITHNELITSEKIDQDNIDISFIISNLDVESRKCNLRYLAVLIYTTSEYNKFTFSEVEKCCFMRYQSGLPSLVLRYESNETKMLPESSSKLYNAMETSLQENYTSVFLSDSKPKSKLYSNDENCKKHGLQMLMNNISKEEMTAIEPVVSMKTFVNNENENELYMNFDEAHVMMVPGFDGSYRTMTTVAERLKISAVTLQLEPVSVTSIQDLAKNLFTIIKKRFDMKRKFYLLGYSFGVNVVLELAALLEREGRTGVVFCLDSSPDALRNQLMAYTETMTEQQLQNWVIEHFNNILSGNISNDLKGHIEQTLEWSEKINILINNTKESVSHSHEFLRSLIDATYNRILLAKTYRPDFKLQSELVLMKGIPHQGSEKLGNDYGLSKYTNKPVKVFDLETDHLNSPQDVRVSNIINNMLDPRLLEEFEQKNLCQYYFI